MKEKTMIIVSVACLICSIVISCCSIYHSAHFLEEVNNIIYQAQNEHEKKITQETESAEVDFIEEETETVETEIVILEEEPEEVVSDEKISLGEFKLTAYCSCEKCCGKWALNRPKDENGKDIVYGSTGNILVAGTSIAVDPSVIPYGSQVEINGHTYTAHDTGGAIKGNRIDVYFDSHQDARNFGVQFAEVFLIGGKQ